MWNFAIGGGGNATRVATAPYGAELTGANWIDNLNGCSYLLATVQHPYERLMNLLKDPASTGVAAYVGYIGPFKL